MYANLSPEKQAEVDQLIAYLDGLLSAPRGFTRHQTTILRDRLDNVLDRPKAQPVVASQPTPESDGADVIDIPDFDADLMTAA